MAERTYATLRKHYSTQQLRSWGFVQDGSRMVKRGACRRERATASSLDGQWWLVTPMERRWK